MKNNPYTGRIKRIIDIHIERRELLEEQRQLRLELDSLMELSSKTVLE